jgi:hypothetical protein
MPVSRHHIHYTDPPAADGNGQSPGNGDEPKVLPLAEGDLNNLRLQQARVLRVLMPTNPTDPPFEWPIFTRANLCLRAGFKLTSGSITRVLNGIRPGNRTSGAPHPGLVERGLVETITLDIEGVAETNYQITAAGIRAYQAYVAMLCGKLPEVKDAATCTNARYAKVQGGRGVLALVSDEGVQHAG